MGDDDGQLPGGVPALCPGSNGSGGPRFGPASSDGAGPHYWIDAVTLDANRDRRTDVFFVEWEPAIGSKLLLDLPLD